MTKSKVVERVQSTFKQIAIAIKSKTDDKSSEELKSQLFKKKDVTTH